MQSGTRVVSLFSLHSSNCGEGTILEGGIRASTLVEVEVSMYFVVGSVAV